MATHLRGLGGSTDIVEDELSHYDIEVEIVLPHQFPVDYERDITFRRLTKMPRHVLAVIDVLDEHAVPLTTPTDW